MAECPYCGESITSYKWRLVEANPIQIVRPKLNCIEIFCPHCNKAISVIYNPDAQTELIVSQLQRR